MALVQHHTDRSMKWLKNGVSAYRDFFAIKKKKKASSALSSFSKLNFFFNYLYLFNCGCISHSTSMCFVSLVLAISVITQRDLPLDLLSISQTSRTASCPSSRPLPRLEEEGGERKGGGKHCVGTHWSRLTRNSQMLGISITEPLVV